jgi:hypothetical protein
MVNKLVTSLASTSPSPIVILPGFLGKVDRVSGTDSKMPPPPHPRVIFIARSSLHWTVSGPETGPVRNNSTLTI